MRTYIKITTIICTLFVIAGCQQFSEKETDQSAGLNGGFEIAKNDLPVNWLMYTPNTVPDAEFEIVLDKTVFKEGLQSLKFDVKSCSSKGGWGSPGFTNEFFDAGKFEGEGTYRLSFWLKNDGASFRVIAGNVAAKEGDMRTVVQSDEQLEEWKYYEFTIDVPEERHLRMELNVLSPGSLWVDDVQVVKI